MTSKTIKIALALGLLSASAAALAATDCCVSVECCLRMLGCC